MNTVVCSFCFIPKWLADMRGIKFVQGITDAIVCTQCTQEMRKKLDKEDRRSG